MMAVFIDDMFSLLNPADISSISPFLCTNSNQRQNFT